MAIHKEGYKPILVSLIVLGASGLALFLISPGFSIWKMLIYISLVAIFAWVIVFFRSPVRTIIKDPGLVLSPADGTVVVNEDTFEGEYFKKPMRQVSILMSPFNVHLNRYPVSGKLLYVKYHPGKYLVAWHPKSSVLNERTSIVIEPEGNVALMVRQVAGVMARRIIYYSQQGQEVTQGDELGFIRFGSRVDLYFPVGTEVVVSEGEKVKGGLSVIAHLSS